MDLKEMKNLTQESQNRFTTKEEHHDFIMFQIQSHLVEINDLLANKDPHSKKEMADLVILTHILACIEDINRETFNERMKKFKLKINSNHKI